MKNFKNRVVVITGAASGIGFALARRFASEGMCIVLADIDHENLAEAKVKLAKYDTKVLTIRTDVTKSTEVQALAQQTLDHFGEIHMLCNNAGVGGQHGSMTEQSEKDWEWVFKVNLWGVIHGVSTFLPIMQNQDSEGYIVNTASMAAHISLPYLAPYHASKFAVLSMTECLYHELTLAKSNVKASIFCPGWVQSNIATTSRKRPEEFGTHREKISKGASLFESAYHKLIANGISTDAAAEIVIEGIREEKFYIFTDPKLLDRVRERTDNVLQQRNPSTYLPVSN